MSGLTVVGQPFKVACKNGSKAKGYVARNHVVAMCNECGGSTVVMVDNLERTNSCGCRRVKHGRYGSAEYRVWSGMIHRCECKNANGFENYGGRGITVCQRWHSFDNFYADMGDRPDGTTLDRIDNDGTYEPSNCRWADDQTQSRNRRTNRVLDIDGVRMCVADWAETHGVSVKLIYRRLHNNWSEREAVFGRNEQEARRSRKRARLLTIGNETRLLSEWVTRSGTSKSTIRNRIARGWTVAEAVFGKEKN